MTAKRKNRISITFQLNAKIGKEKKLNVKCLHREDERQVSNQRSIRNLPIKLRRS